MSPVLNDVPLSRVRGPSHPYKTERGESFLDIVGGLIDEDDVESLVGNEEDVDNYSDSKNETLERDHESIHEDDIHSSKGDEEVVSDLNEDKNEDEEVVSNLNVENDEDEDEKEEEASRLPTEHDESLLLVTADEPKVEEI